MEEPKNKLCEIYTSLQVFMFNCFPIQIFPRNFSCFSNVFKFTCIKECIVCKKWEKGV